MRKLLAFLVVAAVLLVGADFGARYLATRQIGDALQTRLQLSDRPEVSIQGFPFLVEAVQGEYRGISATLPATTVGPLTGVGAGVALGGVRLPLSDAISGDLQNLTADSGRIRLRIPTSSIATAVGLPGLRITETDGTLTVATTVDVLGRQFPVTARLAASVSDSVLSLRSDGINGDGITLPVEVVSAVNTLVDLTVPLDGLPFTVTTGSVSVDGGDVVVDATTSSLTLAGR